MCLPLHPSSTPPFSLAPFRVGVLFSGPPAPGCHNVVAGLLDALTTSTTGSTLVGFVSESWREGRIGREELKTMHCEGIRKHAVIPV